MDALHILRTVLVLIHLIGFAVLFGSWFGETVTRRFNLTDVLRSGLGIMIGSGLLLAIPFPDDVHLNYVKLGVKLGVALAIGAMFGLQMVREKAGKPKGGVAYWLVGVLALTNAGIALFWH